MKFFWLTGLEKLREVPFSDRCLYKGVCHTSIQTNRPMAFCFISMYEFEFINRERLNSICQKNSSIGPSTCVRHVTGSGPAIMLLQQLWMRLVPCCSILSIERAIHVNESSPTGLLS